MDGKELSAQSGGPSFYSVGLPKFVLLSVATFGLYQLFWFYKNWDVIRERRGVDVSPFWRAFFATLWTFSMAEHLNDEAAAKGFKVQLPGLVLGVGYILLCMSFRLPEPYSLLSLLAFLPILPFDYAARRVNGGGSYQPRRTQH